MADSCDRCGREEPEAELGRVAMSRHQIDMLVCDRCMNE